MRRGRAVRARRARLARPARSRSITIHHGREKETSYVEHPRSRDRVDISIHSFARAAPSSFSARRNRSSHTTRKKKKKMGEGGDLFPFFFQRRLRAERYGKNGAIVAGGHRQDE